MNDLPFGRWLQRRRELLDLTQEELARRVGCAEVTIRKIERGERRPSRQIAALLADQLDLTAEERGQFVRFARLPALTPEAVAEPGPPALAPGLPLPATPLLGREHELAELSAYLRRDDVRLLTIVGMPGVGKTRTALEVATSLGDAFPDGVRFVALAPLADPVLVPEAIAEAVGLADQAGDAAQRLATHLRERRMLLLLDNCEHLLDAGPFLADLLAAAPGLTMLATSRTALHLPGEQLFPIGPLALPAAAGAEETGRAVAASPAAQLFAQRARAVQAGFVLGPANAAAVAEICARLDGLPLAIEMAAAWMRVLSAEEIAEETRRGLDILSGDLRDIPERQRSLRAVLDHSWELLSEAERRGLRRLSALPGAFGRAAAEAVAGTSLFTLAALIDHSLLRRAGPGRYDMHPLVRQHAAEQLAAAGDQAETRARLVSYALGVAEAAAGEIDGGDQAAGLARLDRELDTLRAALAVATSADLLRLVGAMAAFWVIRGQLREGRGHADRALASAPSGPTPTLARALFGAGAVILAQRDIDAANGYLFRAADMARALGERALLAAALIQLSTSDNGEGELERAQARVVEAVAIYRELGDRRGLALALGAQGDVADMLAGDNAAARPLFEESLALSLALGDRLGAIWKRKRLADLDWAVGAMAAAQAAYGEALAQARELGDRGAEAWVAVSLSMVAGARDDAAAESQLAAAARAIHAEIGDQSGVAWASVRQGWGAWRAGDQRQATALFEAGLPFYSDLFGGDDGGLGWCEAGLGHVAWAGGKLDQADELLSSSLDRFRRRSLLSDTIFGLNALGHLALARGEAGRAHDLFGEAVVLARGRGDRWGLAVALEGLSAALAAGGEQRRPARLLGAATALRESSGARPWPLYRELVSAARDRLSAALGPAAFAGELARGAGLSPSEVAALVAEP